jgi:hypothetical protein
VSELAILVVAGVAAFGVRSSLVHVVQQVTPGPAVLRVLTITVPAGLAAAAAASLVGRAGTLGVGQLFAVLVTLAIGRRHGMAFAVGSGLALHLAFVGALAW